MKKYCISLCFLFILFFSDVIARAGGGGGGGGFGGGGGGFGGGYGRGGRVRLTKWEREHIPHAFVGLAAIMGLGAWFKYKGYKIPLRSKMKRAASLLKRSGARDPLWAEEYLQKFVRESFFRMQEAWMKRDLDIVSDLLSERLFIKYSKRIDYFIRRQEVNFMSNISIEEIRIVSMQDRKIDDLDRFVAYVKGTMSDVMIDEDVTLDVPLPINEFEDLYYFARYDNQWLLCNIMSDFDFWLVSEMKVVSE